MTRSKYAYVRNGIFLLYHHKVSFRGIWNNVVGTAIVKRKADALVMSKHKLWEKSLKIVLKIDQKAYKR